MTILVFALHTPVRFPKKSFQFWIFYHLKNCAKQSCEWENSSEKSLILDSPQKMTIAQRSFAEFICCPGMCILDFVRAPAIFQWFLLYRGGRRKPNIRKAVWSISLARTQNTNTYAPAHPRACTPPFDFRQADGDLKWMVSSGIGILKKSLQQIGRMSGYRKCHFIQTERMTTRSARCRC